MLGAQAWAAFDRDQLVPAVLATARLRRIRHAAAWPPSCVAGSWAARWSRGSWRRHSHGPGWTDWPRWGWWSTTAAPCVPPSTCRPYAFGGAELWVASDLAAHQRPGVLRHDHVLGIGQASHPGPGHHPPTWPGPWTWGPAAGSSPSTCCTTAGTSRPPTSRSGRWPSPGSTCCSTPPRCTWTRTDLEARVSLRLGSLLEPVAGEEFDLVVSNPPFVITPRSAGESRHGPVHLPRRRPAGGRDRGFAGPRAALGPGPGRNSPAPGQLGDPGGRRLGGTARKAGPARTPTSGSSSASRWARSSTPRPGCRTPPRTATAGSTRTPTPPTWTTSPPAMWRRSASA